MLISESRLILTRRYCIYQTKSRFPTYAQNRKPIFAFKGLVTGRALWPYEAECRFVSNVQILDLRPAIRDLWKRGHLAILTTKHTAPRQRMRLSDSVSDREAGFKGESALRHRRYPCSSNQGEKGSTALIFPRFLSRFRSLHFALRSYGHWTSRIACFQLFEYVSMLRLPRGYRLRHQTSAMHESRRQQSIFTRHFCVAATLPPGIFARGCLVASQRKS